MTMRRWLVVAVLLAVRISGQTPIPDILYLPFNEGTGSTTTDFASPGIGGTLTFSTVFPSWGWETANPALGPAAWRCGTSSAAGIELSANAAPAVTSFTIEAWMQTPPFGFLFYVLCSTCLGGPNNLCLGYQRLGSTSDGFGLGYAGLNYFLVPASMPPTGSWNHHAWVFDGVANTVTIYLNAVPIGNYTLGANPGLAQVIGQGCVIGGLYSCSQWTMVPGGLDELRIWGYARTQSDIQSTMSAELVGGYAPASINFSPPSVPTFNVGLSQFSSTDTPSTLEFGASTNPTASSLYWNNPTIALSSSYSGADLVGLSDVTLSPLSLRITVVPNVDELIITNIVTGSGSPIEQRLGGPSGAQIFQSRLLRQIGPANATRIGSGTALLDGIATRIAGGARIEPYFDLTASGPRLAALKIDYQPPPTIPAATFGTDGVGNARIGAVGLTPGAELRNIFVVGPTSPVGSGPFFGLEFSTSIFDQLLVPLPTTPFRVPISPQGSYAWASPVGVLPPGLIVDGISIEVIPGSPSLGFVSTAQRITF